jgi:hypothetical protein
VKRSLVFASWAFILILSLAGLTGCISSSFRSQTAPTITSFTASSSTITAGSSTNLTGVFSGGTGVIAPGNLTATSGTAVPVTPTDTTIYTLTVTNSAGATAYKTATVTVSAAIAQTISFTAPASPVTFGAAPITLTAAGGGSGNPIVFTVDASSTGTGTISGNTLTITGAGTIVIDANQAGNSTYAAASQVQRSIVVNAAIPAAPTGLTAAAGNATVGLSWTAVTGATTYNVYRGTTSGGESATAIAIGITPAAYTDNSVINSQPYFYKVAAVNGAGTSSKSNEASATPSATACSTLTATDTGVAEIDLSWTACPGATSYLILRSTTSGGPYTALTVSTGMVYQNTTLVSSLTYQDFGLVSMKKYYYVIQAVNSAGMNDQSNESSATFTSAHVSQDANGWTTVIPSSDSKQYYVSSSTGSDSTGDGSQAKPYATIKKAVNLLRTANCPSCPGYPDWILLKAGDIWYQDFGYFGQIGGRSADEPMVFTRYGSGPRPQMRFTDNGDWDGFKHSGPATYSHCYFMGLEFYDSRKDPSSPDYESKNGIATANDTGAISNVQNGNDILLEDNYVHFTAGAFGAEMNNGVGPEPNNIRIRRNIITDLYSVIQSNPQAMFMDHVNNLLIEDNLFDHNAWNDQAGDPATIFDHHMYIVDSPMTTVRNNLMLRDESLSLKLQSYAATTGAFPGALVYNNFIFEGEVGISVNGTPPSNGVGSAITGFKVDNNVLLQVNRDNPTQRGLGWGIEVGSVSESFFTRNIFTDFSYVPDNTFAIKVTGDDNTFINTGITIDNNLSYRVTGAAIDLVPLSQTSNIKVLNNTLQNQDPNSEPDLGAQLIDVEGVFTPYTFSGNTYYDGTNASEMFQVGAGGTFIDYAQWVTQSGETGSSNQQIAYPDPGRNLESYDASLGGASSLNPIFAAIRSQSRATWNPAYTAEAVNDYIRNGFNVAPQGGGVGNPTAPPAPVTTLSATPGSGSVTLNWTAPSGGPTFYIVYRGTTAGGENMVSPVATYGTGSTWTDTTAVHGTTYYYQAASMNAGGFGGLSNEVSATP